MTVLRVEIKHTFGRIGAGTQLPASALDIDETYGIELGSTLPGPAGLSRPQKFKLLDQNQAYQVAMDSTYFRWASSNWVRLGEPEDFLQSLIRCFINKGYTGDKLLSWPEAWPDPPKFQRNDMFQVLPYRELIRRHVRRCVTVIDVDLEFHHWVWGHNAKV